MKKVTPLLTALLAATACAATSTCANAGTVTVLATSFDCARASATIEKLICRDPQLKQMEIEMTRLYRLALTDDHSVPPPDKVEIDQRFWVIARNQCATEAEPKTCTIRSYAERAHQLRQGSAIVRTKDPHRLTDGPVAFRCAGLNALIAATYFHVEPRVLYLKWANTSVTLVQVPNVSATQYNGKDFRGNYSFWQDGNDAWLQLPGSGRMTCTAEPVG
ncbi:MliC family protein [Pseudomonas izuensis]|uniref:MliC family protein n=1 Tax=Pseudomonas izuensis TaxID=2684212 RepID=UPI00080C185D|nr:MliC family protein [Pseudomonas izuensis]